MKAGSPWHPEVVAYGGMRGAGVPIGARPVARAATGPARVAGDTTAPLPGRSGPADLPLHCWVTHWVSTGGATGIGTGIGAGGGAGIGAATGAGRSPGILLEWRHESDRWWGMVVFVAGDDGGRPVVVTRLLPAEVLSPA